ncbi:MAG: hypothetical protein HY929_07075 [Euryarchaeota archaeon]|nr:hypothetical protein [Euryarchaeota archaeon]
MEDIYYDEKTKKYRNVKTGKFIRKEIFLNKVRKEAIAGLFIFNALVLVIIYGCYSGACLASEYKGLFVESAIQTTPGLFSEEFVSYLQEGSYGWKVRILEMSANLYRGFANFPLIRNTIIGKKFLSDANELDEQAQSLRLQAGNVEGLVTRVPVI